MRNYSLKWGVVTILSINCCPRLKHYLWNCAQPIVCLLSHNVITTCINLHLFCEICFWTLIEIFCFCTVFVIFVRWRLSVRIKRFTYLLTLSKMKHKPVSPVATCKLITAANTMTIIIFRSTGLTSAAITIRTQCCVKHITVYDYTVCTWQTMTTGRPRLPLHTAY